MKKIPLLTFVLFLSLLTGGCASYLTQSRNVSGEKKPYAKILVITRAQNQVARSLSEQDIASALRDKGTAAVASLKDGVEVPLDRELTPEESAALKQRFLDQGFDGVVVTHLVNTEQYREVIPMGVYASTDPYNYGQFGSYLTYYPAMDWAPGTVVEGTRHELESALYDLRADSGKALQWVGRFKLEDPADIRKSSQRYAGELVSALMGEAVSKR